MPVSRSTCSDRSLFIINKMKFLKSKTVTRSNNHIKILFVSLIALIICCVVNTSHSPKYHYITVDADVHTISFSVDDKRLAVATLRNGFDDKFHLSYGGVRVYDVESREKIKDLLEFTPPYNPLGEVEAYYSVGGSQLIVRDVYGKSSVYDSSSLESTNQKPASYICPSFAICGADSYAKVVASKEKDAVLIRTHDYQKIESVERTPSYYSLCSMGNKLAIAGGQGDVFIFDIKSKKIVSHISCRESNFDGMSSPINSLVWIAPEGVLWITNNEGRSILWDSASGLVRSDVMIHKVVECASVNHGGNRVAIGGNDKVVIVSTNKLLDAMSDGSVVNILD